jgi:hypothetical protein
MSAFLAPIHYWLFNKIQRVEKREQRLFDLASDMCGSTAEELREQVWQSYGEPLPEKDLSEMIDQSNIHGWLQKQINIVESREAAFVKEMTAMCGDAGLQTATKAFAEDGDACGSDAKESGRYDLSTANGIYKAMNDYFLNGMPCDQADMLVENSADKVVWQGGACLQEKNWTRAGIDAKPMTSLYRAWFVGFVQAANPAFAYAQTADILNGDSVSKHEITRQ